MSSIKGRIAGCALAVAVVSIGWRAASRRSAQPLLSPDLYQAASAQIQSTALSLSDSSRGDMAAGFAGSNIAPISPVPPGSPTPGSRSLGQVERKIVKNASVSIEVRNYAAERKSLLAIARRMGAEVQSDSTSRGAENAYGVIVLEAPPEKLDALLDSLEGLGRVLERSLSETNMTAEYVDIKSRMANLRRVEKRLHELLASKTYTLGDVLQLEQQLERIGGEIEQAEGRMKYIDRLAANSIVTVRLSQPAREPIRTHGATYGVANIFVRAGNAFVATGLLLLNAVALGLAIGVWIVPLAAIAYAIKLAADAYYGKN
ncbi:MAG: DUF4349 domain-containing protein [Elusimicrobia bacterium]|nr:DUF4349 domain-containing protein [Elusimicrobiota bacterium]